MSDREQKVITIPAYWLIVGLCVMLGSPVASIFAAVAISNNNARQIVAEQQRSQQAAREESRRVACSFFATSLDVYQETPPTTATGRNLQENYLEFYRISGCVPPRTK